MHVDEELLAPIRDLLGTPTVLRWDGEISHFADGVWRPPGGGIRPGEDFVTGAVREAREETGLRV